MKKLFALVILSSSISLYAESTVEPKEVLLNIVRGTLRASAGSMLMLGAVYGTWMTAAQWHSPSLAKSTKCFRGAFITSCFAGSASFLYGAYQDFNCVSKEIQKSKQK